ncbi:MAG: cyclase family protein [Planctomycetales bacterium]|nr:cyclase family protein [Planctomycetales bacterium]
MKRIHDIGLPLYNGMWSYRENWANKISPIARTADGDASTVYRFSLCSHSGTYVETSQHKLNNEVLLSSFPLSAFVRPCKLISIGPCAESEEVTLDTFLGAIAMTNFSIDVGDTLIIATGWGRHHRSANFLDSCPFFSPQLTEWLSEKRLHLLGVDTPIIDNQRAPYAAIKMLFQANETTLVVAPLCIDINSVVSGSYELNCVPLNIESVSASLCRPILLENVT